MTRIVYFSAATGVLALLACFQPWTLKTQSQESYRVEAEPAVSLTSLPRAPQQAKSDADSATASSAVRTTPEPAEPGQPDNPGNWHFTQAPCPVNGGVVVQLSAPPPFSPMNPTQSTAQPPAPFPPPAPVQKIEDKLIESGKRKGEAKTDAAGTPPPVPGIVPGVDTAIQPPLPTPAVSPPTGSYAGPLPPPLSESPPGGFGTPPIPPAPMQPKRSAEPVAPAKPFTSPWGFHLEFVDGKNLITAKVGKTVQFRVVCDKLEIQSPMGHIQASGLVKITSHALEASCDRLTIQPSDEAVLLEGTAHMKCQHDGQELDLHADSLKLKLSDIQGKAPAVPSTSTSSYPARPPIVSADPGTSITSPRGKD